MPTPEAIVIGTVLGAAAVGVIGYALGWHGELLNVSRVVVSEGEGVQIVNQSDEYRRCLKSAFDRPDRLVMGDRPVPIDFVFRRKAALAAERSCRSKRP